MQICTTAVMQFAEMSPWIEAFNINYHLGIDGISMPAFQSLAEAVVSLPLVVVFLGGAIFFFLIHFFKGHK